MKNTLINSLLFLLLIIISYFAFRTYNLELEKRKLNEDWVELSDIKYGMLNADRWRDQIAEIISTKVNELSLSKQDRKQAEKTINSFLIKTIDQFEQDYKKTNKKKSLLGISLKNIGADAFNIFPQMKEQVPNISKNILDFIEQDESKSSLKKFIIAQINEYRNTTFQEVDYRKFETILAAYNTSNKNDCKAIIQDQTKQVEQQINDFNWVILSCLSLILLLLILGKDFTKNQTLLLMICATVFLLLGISLPMINIDARITSLDFFLMGEKISFKDQVLFFKSKSILEVSQLMLSQKEIKVIMVGILVLLFSVFFPLAKLIASTFLLFNEKLKHNPIIQFLVFKVGKWSMADVMVVAIFMSYLAFTSIISNQLNQMEYSSESISLFTTNYSELQNGFFYFLTFVILSILISQTMSKKLENRKINN